MSEKGACVHSGDEPHHTEVVFCPLSVTHPPLAQALSYNLFGWLLSPHSFHTSLRQLTAATMYAHPTTPSYTEL